MPWPEAWFHDVKHRHSDDALGTAREMFGNSRTGSTCSLMGSFWVTFMQRVKPSRSGLGLRLDGARSIDNHWQDLDGFIKANDRWLGDEVRLL